MPFKIFEKGKYLPKETRCTFRREIPVDQLRPITPYPTGRSFGGSFPGTSCQATIMLSLWDEKGFRAEALIKLLLTYATPIQPSEIVNDWREPTISVPCQYHQRTSGSSIVLVLVLVFVIELGPWLWVKSVDPPWGC